MRVVSGRAEGGAAAVRVGRGRRCRQPGTHQSPLRPAGAPVSARGKARQRASSAGSTCTASRQMTAGWRSARSRLTSRSAVAHSPSDPLCGGGSVRRVRDQRGRLPGAGGRCNRSPAAPVGACGASTHLRRLHVLQRQEAAGLGGVARQVHAPKRALQQGTTTEESSRGRAEWGRVRGHRLRRQCSQARTWPKF